MEETMKKIKRILDQFTQEEVGNRLSQFAMLALRTLILDTLIEEPSKGETECSKES